MKKIMDAKFSGQYFFLCWPAVCVGHDAYIPAHRKTLIFGGSLVLLQHPTLSLSSVTMQLYLQDQQVIPSQAFYLWKSSSKERSISPSTRTLSTESLTSPFEYSTNKFCWFWGDVHLSRHLAITYLGLFSCEIQNSKSITSKENLTYMEY